MNNDIYNTNTELYHHGILGQKWGIRRYQNPDGTLTTEGKKHTLELKINGDHFSEKYNTKNIKKAAALGALALTALSLVQTKQNYDAVNLLLDDFGRISTSELISKGTIAAGKAALIGVGIGGGASIAAQTINRHNDRTK